MLLSEARIMIMLLKLKCNYIYKKAQSTLNILKIRNLRISVFIVKMWIEGIYGFFNMLGTQGFKKNMFPWKSLK